MSEFLVAGGYFGPIATQNTKMANVVSMLSGKKVLTMLAGCMGALARLSWLANSKALSRDFQEIWGSVRSALVPEAKKVRFDFASVDTQNVSNPTLQSYNPSNSTKLEYRQARLSLLVVAYLG